MAGCGFGGTPITGSTPVAGTSNNWELVTTATAQGSSAQPLTDLSGSILEEASGNPHRATAVFQATSGCYADAEIIPLDGSFSGSAFQARSFGVRGQFLTLNGTLDTAASHMTGTYSIGGGCGNGEAGTLAGTRYSTVTGTFAGGLFTLAGSHQVTLDLVQNPDPTGEGSFLLTGTGTFSDFSCFTTGTVQANAASISGSKLTLNLIADGANGVAINLSGNIDPTAATLTVNALQITGGGCAGNYGPLTLQRTK